MVQRKTAAGKMLDMNALIAKNERTRAVGNMNVNARGDIIDSHNRVITDSSKRINTLYNKTMQRAKANLQLATPLPKDTTEIKDETKSTKKSELMDDFENYDDGWDEKQKK